MKQYIMPQTQAQYITTGQIICNSPNPTIGKNDDPLSGEPGGKIIYGN